MCHMRSTASRPCPYDGWTMFPPFSDTELEEIERVSTSEVGGRTVMQDEPDWEVLSLGPRDEDRRVVVLALREIHSRKNVKLEIWADDFDNRPSGANANPLTERSFNISVRLMEFFGMIGLDDCTDDATVRLALPVIKQNPWRTMSRKLGSRFGRARHIGYGPLDQS